MMVIRLPSRVIAKASTAQVSLGNQMQCFQQLQGSIHSGDVNVGILGIRVAANFLRANNMVITFSMASSTIIRWGVRR